MDFLLKLNKNLLIYILFFVLIVPIFGLNFLIGFLGNILLLIILIPILILLVAFISFNSLKSKLKTCESCGTISFGLNNKCLNCGASLEKDISTKLNQASETTIEIKAEEIQ